MQKPTLAQYGLANVNIDQLSREHSIFVENEKSKQKKKDFKVNVGFVITLFTWCCPLLGIIHILQILYALIFLPDAINLSEIKVSGLIYVGFIILGTIYTFRWSNWAEDADKTKKGNPDLRNFNRKSEWERLLQYNRACQEYDVWERKCKRESWEALTGLQFEAEVASLFSKNGYKTTKTRATNDGGVDIILIHGSERIAVQCKAYKNKISPSIARDLYGVLNAGNYTSGIIATINGASLETKAFCRRCINKPIKIIDLDDLIMMQKTL